MTELAIFTIAAFLFLLLLRWYSWMLFMLFSILIFWLTISATNLNFPYWKIYLPQMGVSLVFTLFFIVLPITILNGLALYKAIMIIRQHKKRKAEYLILTILTLGLLCLGVGITHNAYQMIPANNFNLYLKHREYIVNLIKAGTLHGKNRCIQNKFELNPCFEEIELPDKYKGLSRGGKVVLSTISNRLFIRFTHSTYNFGDGSINIVYSSSIKDLSESKWEIN